VRYSRVIPVAGRIASRNPRSSPPAQYSAPEIAEAGSPWQHRSPGILWALSLVSYSAGCAKDPPTRDRYPLASRWFPSLLALEITTAQRPAKDPRGHSPAHSRDERCQSLVRSAADSRRTAQARGRRRPNHGCKIHGQKKAATVARLEDLPSQSCRRYCVNRPVCRPHDFVSAVVCASGPAAFAARAVVVGRDGTSKCRMDRPSINRGLRLE
jgi:hypothetical protein